MCIFFLFLVLLVALRLSFSLQDFAFFLKKKNLKINA